MICQILFTPISREVTAGGIGTNIIIYKTNNISIFSDSGPVTL